MSTTMSVSEARAALPRIVDLVWAGNEVTLTRHGQPVAVVVRPDRLRARRADAAMATAERVRQLIEEGRSTPLDAAPGLTHEQAEELLAEVRRSRESR
jgi:prevent-host-death family protein